MKRITTILFLTALSTPAMAWNWTCDTYTSVECGDGTVIGCYDGEQQIDCGDHGDTLNEAVYGGACASHGGINGFVEEDITSIQEADVREIVAETEPEPAPEPEIKTVVSVRR